jgi:hypothetical protein
MLSRSFSGAKNVRMIIGRADSAGVADISSSLCRCSEVVLSRSVRVDSSDGAASEEVVMSVVMAWDHGK